MTDPLKPGMHKVSAEAMAWHMFETARTEVHVAQPDEATGILLGRRFSRCLGVFPGLYVNAGVLPKVAR